MDTTQNFPPFEATEFRRHSRRGHRHQRHDFAEAGRFGPPDGRARGRGGRRARGDIRLALIVLIAEEPRHGYELMQAVADRTDGQWQPSPGSVYPALQQLQDEGLIVLKMDDQNRGVAHLTEAGQKYVEENQTQLEEVWDSVSRRDGKNLDMRHRMHGLVLALKQVQSVGTPAQIEQAGAVMDEAQRKIYAILAAEPTESE